MKLMQLVRYRPEYQEAILDLHRNAKAGFTIIISQLDEEADLRAVEQVYLRSGGEFLIGLLDETVIAMGGYERLSDTSAELRRMRIRKDLQDKGFGRQLLQELESRAFRAGIINISFETARARPLTLEFYRKHGYQETGGGFYHGVETVHFRKTLGGIPAKGQAIYDSIGKKYNNNRSADPRILAVIRTLLDLPTGSVIADIGAGTGNYANALAEAGYLIKAVEPSEEMRRQATPNGNVEWLTGTAESIPLKDDSVQGVIVVLAVHHFSDLELATKEIARICPKGPIVIFTMDPREGEEFWFDNYFPEITNHVLRSFPPLLEVLNTIVSGGNWSGIIRPFPLPPDLTDRNMCSAWNQPEMYLDTEMRQNTSGFALASPTVVGRRLSKLQYDLQSGDWDKHYGHLRKRSCFDAGFRFLTFKS